MTNLFCLTNVLYSILVSLPSIPLKAIWLFIIIILLLSLIFFRKEKHSISTCKISKPVFHFQMGSIQSHEGPSVGHKKFHHTELLYNIILERSRSYRRKIIIIKVWLQNHMQIHFTQGPNSRRMQRSSQPLLAFW